MKSTSWETAWFRVLKSETIGRGALAWALRGCGALLLGASAFAQSLVNGGVVSGAISAPGETDTYTFDAQRRDWFEMRLADVSASTFSPQIELYNPNGLLISTSAGPDVAVIDTMRVKVSSLGRTPPGTYTVVVSNASPAHSQTGAYDLHFVLAPGANEGGELIDGLTVFGEIELGDLDSFTFVVKEGQTAQGTVIKLDEGTVHLRKERFGPSGSYSDGVGSLGQFYTSSPGTHTIVLSDSRGAGTGRYSIVVRGIAAAPPYPPSVFWPAEYRHYDPLLLDTAGNPGLGPRIGDPREPFNLSIDCTAADSPSFYVMSLWTGMQSGSSTPLGLLYTDGQRLLRKSGRHAQSVETWFPTDTGLPLPDDPSLVGVTYTVQGVCGGGYYEWPARLTGAITQTIGS